MTSALATSLLHSAPPDSQAADSSRSPCCSERPSSLAAEDCWPSTSSSCPDPCRHLVWRRLERPACGMRQSLGLHEQNSGREERIGCHRTQFGSYRPLQVQGLLRRSSEDHRCCRWLLPLLNRLASVLHLLLDFATPPSRGRVARCQPSWLARRPGCSVGSGRCPRGISGTVAGDRRKT